MPITILDLVLLGVMLISGLLAMVRGFMREILSIAAWGATASQGNTNQSLVTVRSMVRAR